jgi:uncharacterized protein (TIGR03435 family)
MIANLLEDRFKLSLHRGTKEVPVYNVLLIKMGNFRMSADQTPPDPPSPRNGPPPASVDPAGPPRGAFGIGVDPPAGKVRVMANAIALSQFLNFIQGTLGRMAVDKTGITGLIDIPEQTFDVGPYDISPGAPSVWPEIFRQLGLNMQSSRGPAETLIVDHAEKPQEN